MINPAEIPVIAGDMAALSGHAATLTSVGGQFADTGSRVHSTWQSLAPHYIAPEADQLFAATAPIPGITSSVGDDLLAVGHILRSYAEEVSALQAELAGLRGQAAEFVGTVGADPDWRQDQAQVDRHNQLLGAVNAAAAAFQDAERRCANAILARYTDLRHVPDNGDGILGPGEHGYTRETLDALAAVGAVAWGTPEQHDRGFWGDVGAFWGGVGEGGWQAVTGLGALVGLGPDGTFSADTAGTAWQGLSLFALAFTPAGIYNRYADLPLVGIPRGTLDQTVIAASEGLVAYDLWGVDNARAAGIATFNIVSAVLGTKGTGAALRVSGAAASASRVAVLANAGAGLVRIGELIGRLPTVGQAVTGVGGRLRGLVIPPVDLPPVDLPPAHVDPPRIEPPDLPPDRPAVGDAIPPDRPEIGDRPPPDRPDIGDGITADPPPDRAAAPDGAPADRLPEPGGDAPPNRPDLGTQPDGSWRGEERGTPLELDPELNRAADDILRNAREAEASVTPVLRGVVDDVDGAHLRGYPEHALKSPMSLKRKIATEFGEADDVDPAELPAAINDALRYTVEFPDGSYVDGVARAVDDLRANGFDPVEFKVRWDVPDAYKGVNSTWLDPRTGQRFELQFHTPTSLEAKTVTHDIYEAARLPNVSPADRLRFDQEQAEWFQNVRRPPGADRLAEIRDGLLDPPPPARPGFEVDGWGALTQAATQAGAAEQAAEYHDR